MYLEALSGQVNPYEVKLGLLKLSIGFSTLISNH